MNDQAAACQPVATDQEPLQTERVVTENDSPEPLLSPSTPKVKDKGILSPYTEDKSKK